MSVLQKLTEGVQHRDMQAEGAALLNKWEATGLLEGLNSGQQKQGMAVLLENQAKELLREASSMAAGDVEGFAAVAFPIVRRVFGGLISNDLISVQPMSLPSGLIFFLDFTHEGTNSGFAAGSSLYGGGVVGKEIVDGVKEIEETGFYGLRSGYAAGTSQIRATSPSVSTGHADGSAQKESDHDPDMLGNCVLLIKTTGNELSTPATGVDLKEVDPGAARALMLTAIADSANADVGAQISAHTVTVISDDEYQDLSDARKAVVKPGDVFIGATAGGNNDFLGLSVANNEQGLVHLRPRLRLASFETSTNADGLKQVDQLDRFALEVLSVQDRGADAGVAGAQTDAELADRIITKVGAFSLTAVERASVATALEAWCQAVTWTFDVPVRDEINAQGLGALAAGQMPLEEATNAANSTPASGADGAKNAIAEIDIKVDSIAVTAQTKKLKAKWSPELGQDLNAYHNLDAEVELTGILSEQIALEIDRELLGELVDGATAGTRYWSRAPGLFVDADGAELGARSAAPDFTGTVSEWYETLIETINDVSAQIHRKTLRGGANFVVCSPEVANILEFTSGFRASVTADQDRGTIGAVKAGSLSKKFDVYVDPYFLRNVILVGRKGSSFLESGYVYAPYVPLQVTPTIFGTEDFVPRKGVMTRYAKKMVRPDMYGLVVVRGLLGESGS